MKAFLILILITSCATKIPGNYLVPKEGDSGGVIFLSLTLLWMTELPNQDTMDAITARRTWGKGRTRDPTLPKTKELLNEFYRPYNMRLARVLGDKKWEWTDV